MRFRGWKVGKLGEMLDPLETKQIDGSKSTKYHQTNRSQNFLGLFLVGNFRNWEEHNKNKLENRVWGSKIVINLCSGYHRWYRVEPYGADLSRNGGDPTMNTKNTKGNHEGNTQEQVQSHIH